MKGGSKLLSLFCLSYALWPGNNYLFNIKVTLPFKLYLPLCMEINTSDFPGFELPLSSVKKFKASADLFTFLLHDGTIVHRTITDPVSFKKWLEENGIENIATVI